MNTWPDRHRRAMSQSEHAAWNARNYPGTRQLCGICESETGRCEDDSLFAESGKGPLCPACWYEAEEGWGDVDPGLQAV
jgi:hypothetical protein